MAVVVDALETEVVTEAPPPPPSRRRLGLEQLLVATGQLGAGLGNLAFTLVAARLLSPSGFARLSVFLGLYLILSLPTTSLSAATALDPARRDLLVRRVGALSVVVAVVGAASSPFLGRALHLSWALVVLLAAALPAAAGLALERGRLYGFKRHPRVVASLLAEPVVRLSVGVVLAAWAGAAGGALGVVLAAYLALEVARLHQRGRRSRRGAHMRTRRLVSRGVSGELAAAGDVRAVPGPGGLAAAAWTAVAFALLAVVQNLDLVFANASLPGPQAGLYAALSTLGGAAAFATITIPLVLIPRAVRDERHSVAVAVATAAVIGGAAVVVGAAGSRLLVTGLFGSRYAGISHLVVPYLGAMALLGVARVFVAERCARGGAAGVAAITALVVGLQAVLLATVGNSVDAIAMTTLAATATLTGVLGVEQVVRRCSYVSRLRAALRAAWRVAAADRAVQVLVGVTVVGLAVRLVVWRGLWLDEATSVHQVHMSFSGMISDLRNTDVHPPLYFSILWADVRAFGYGSMAVRIPSILAGLLVVPGAYLAGRDLWDRRSGLVAAAFASVGPLLVWYSQEVRMYSLFMLFAVLAIWGQARIIRYGQVRDWAVYVLACAGLVWTEYFGAFQVIAQQLFFGWMFIRRRPSQAKVLAWLAATVALVALVLPLVPFAWHQFIVNQNAGKGFGTPSQTSLAGTSTISVYTVLANLAWAAIGYHSGVIMEALVALWPLGILASLFILGRKATLSTKLVIATAVIPALMLLVAGMEKRFLYDVRYMAGVAVALVLVAARMVTGSSRSTRLQAMSCVAVAAVLTVGLADEQFNGTNPRLYDFSGVLTSVNRNWKPGDVVLYAPSSIGVVINYYSPEVRAEPLGTAIPTVSGGDAIYVLDSPSLMTGSGPGLVQRMLKQLRTFERPTGVLHKSNVTLWSFSVPSAPPAAAGGPSAAVPGSGATAGGSGR